MALNVLYTIGIVLSLIAMYRGFNTGHYLLVIGGLFVGALCVILKIGLVKEVRQMERPVPPPPPPPKKKRK